MELRLQTTSKEAVNGPSLYMLFQCLEFTTRVPVFGTGFFDIGL